MSILTGGSGAAALPASCEDEMTAEERRRDRLAGVFGLALAGAAVATLVAGPLGAHPQATTPVRATTPTHTIAPAWRPNPVQIGTRLLAHWALP
jgi:hypothetical protein